MMFNCKDILLAANVQELKNELGNNNLFNISTDTRTIQNGDIYLPLKGANFDGEKFIQQALESGAIGYFTTGDDVFDNAKVVFKVKNTLETYLDIAKYQRQKQNPITVSVTGSSGKTTTKELLYSVLSQNFKTQKTLSNHNNEIGFCQTVLGMNSDTEVLIVEMGMRGLGEIELISTHLQPDIAIITNSGSAHIGRLGSLDNIAIAKCEIVSGLKDNGTFISLNQEIIKKHLNFNGEKIFYSLNEVEILEKAPSYSKFKYKDEIYELNVEGDYNIENALSAIETGLKLSMTPDQIRKGLASYRPIEKRWEIEKIKDFNFINDSYNANPESMKASVKTFVELYENPVVVLGNMGELGENEIEYHKEVGEFLAQLNNKGVTYLTVGDLAAEIGNVLIENGYSVKNFNSTDEVSCYILENLNNSYTIFLKASRSMQFEKILEYIKKRDM